MRGLSLTQPWASLVAIGAKQWETRSWPTQFRGQIVIHASKSYPKDCRELEYEEPFLSALKRGLPSPHMLPTGSVIGLATIENCLPTSQFKPAFLTSEARAIVHDLRGIITISHEEYEFGDYSEGRYAFRIANVMQLRTPIPCRSALNFWPVPDAVVAQIHLQLIDMQHDAAVRTEARGEAEVR